MSNIFNVSIKGFKEKEKQIDESSKLIEDEFEAVKEGITKIIEADLEKRKTITPEYGSDKQNFNLGTDWQDEMSMKDFKPLFDYESAVDNPNLLRANDKNLRVDATYKVEVSSDNSGIHVEIRSLTDVPLPKDLSTPLLDQKINDYLASVILEGKDAKIINTK